MNFNNNFMPNFNQPQVDMPAPGGMSQPNMYAGFAQPMYPQSCCQQAMPTYQCCNQVVNRCNVQDVPHVINYHTHVVDNCVRRHVTIPQYSTSESMQYFDEYVQGQPAFTPYQQPMNQMGQSGMCGNNNPFMF